MEVHQTAPLPWRRLGGAGKVDEPVERFEIAAAEGVQRVIGQGLIGVAGDKVGGDCPTQAPHERAERPQASRVIGRDDA